MSDSLTRRTLARAAAHLAAGKPLKVPPLVLMTDDERLPDPLPAVRALPRGSMVVVRARQPAQRKALARAILEVARLRHLVVLIAGDAALALDCGADGVHLPEARIGEAAGLRARHGALLITAAVHSLAAITRAAAADALFLSPVFPTRSHPGRPALTAARAGLIARRARVPVYALGGIGPANTRLLSRDFAGLAAIGALASDVQA